MIFSRPPQPLACGPWCAALPSAFYRGLGCDWGVRGGQPARPQPPKAFHSSIWCPYRHFWRGGGVIYHQPALPGLYDYLRGSHRLANRLANRRPVPEQLTRQTWHVWGGGVDLPAAAMGSHDPLSALGQPQQLSTWPTAVIVVLSKTKLPQRWRIGALSRCWPA